jgi:hypothetical protein
MKIPPSFTRTQHALHAAPDLLGLEPLGLSGLVGDGGDRGIGAGAPQGADRALAVDHYPDAECPGQLQHLGISQVRPQLGKIGPVEGSGVEIDQRITVVDDSLEERVGDSRRGAPGGMAGEVTVHVATVRQVAGASPESVKIRHRNPEQHSRDLLRTHVFEELPHDLDPVQLVPVDPGRHAEDRTRSLTADGEHRDLHGISRERFARPQEEPTSLSGRHVAVQELHGAPGT